MKKNNSSLQPRTQRCPVTVPLWGPSFIFGLFDPVFFFLFLWCRLERYQEFKNFKKRILVGTDLFGRGMDIERVNIVFNYDMPDDSDTYLHRVSCFSPCVFRAHYSAITTKSKMATPRMKKSFWYANLVKMRKKQFTINFKKWTLVFLRFEVHTPFKSCRFWHLNFFRWCKMFLQRKNFIS